MISIVAFVAFIFNKLTVYVVLLANSVGGCKIVLKFLITITIILQTSMVITSVEFSLQDKMLYCMTFGAT